jgi:hypothetical protein
MKDKTGISFALRKLSASLFLEQPKMKVELIQGFVCPS